MPGVGLKAAAKGLIAGLLVVLVNASAGDTDDGGGDFLLSYISILVSAIQGKKTEPVASIKASRTRGEVPLNVAFDGSARDS